MSSIDRAKAILADVANVETNRMAERLVAEGIAQWEDDSVVEGIVGLILVGTNEAAILVYLDEEDFEVSARYEEESYTGKPTAN